MTSLHSKPLLIGASGQIGSQMLHLLGRERCMVTSRKPNSGAKLVLDLAAIATVAEVEQILDGHAIEVIYCLAGMTNVEGCEDVPELAHNTNCRGPELLARFAKARNIPFVYFSTEYVFDGNNGPYVEEDIANPLGVYGKSKWEGERAILAAYSHALILRTTVVYGHDFGEKNYIYSLMRSLGASKPMLVPQDQISTPTYNRDLAKTAIALAERGATGIFHTCGPERMDRLEFARAIAACLGLDGNLLQGLPTSALGQKAPRPLSAGLSIAKLTRLHPDLTMRSISEGLADCRRYLADFLRTSATLT
jgi:dTDP-4-dehydrorhamnose reductase